MKKIAILLFAILLLANYYKRLRLQTFLITSLDLNYFLFLGVIRKSGVNRILVGYIYLPHQYFSIGHNISVRNFFLFHLSFFSFLPNAISQME